MTEEIVKQFNRTVGENDILYHLGDWSFGGIDKIWQFRKQLNVKEIHFIYGNHDHNIISGKKISLLKEDWDRYSYLCDGGIDPWSSYDGKAQVSPRSFFASCQHYKEITINGQSFVLSHFKHAIWNGSSKGWIHLYGHSHSTAEHWKIGKSMDVGIDNAKKLLGEYRPFSLEEVLNLMKDRKVEFNDHHDSSTNVR